MARPLPLIAACLAVAAMGSADVVSANTPATGQVIALKNFVFTPSLIMVPVGTRVIWTNLDEEPHTVVSSIGLFRSDALDQNDSFSFEFDEPGEYRFICSIHPQMHGTVIAMK